MGEDPVNVQVIEQQFSDMFRGVDGWCTPHKASVLYQLARAPEVKIGLEIGIFAGKSMFPVCQAFKDKGEGKHFGIEPWSNLVAVETATNDANDQWWSKVDMRAIKRQFFSNLLRFELIDHVAIVESPSDSAYSLFSTNRFRGKIDLLHIDGSHSTPEALHDVTNWTKLVSPGGYVVLDDIEWPSVGLAYEYLKMLGNEVHKADDEVLGHFSVVKLH
jgi:predicted O-methyltransferase YrrM